MGLGGRVANSLLLRDFNNQEGCITGRVADSLAKRAGWQQAIPGWHLQRELVHLNTQVDDTTDWASYLPWHVASIMGFSTPEISSAKIVLGGFEVQNADTVAGKWVTVRAVHGYDPRLANLALQALGTAIEYRRTWSDSGRSEHIVQRRPNRDDFWLRFVPYLPSTYVGHGHIDVLLTRVASFHETLQQLHLFKCFGRAEKWVSTPQGAAHASAIPTHWDTFGPRRA
ncbi:hypothetical protein ACOME3_006666 [Neoechinorhynchus agilis]